MSRSVGVILDDAIVRTGWDANSIIDVLVQYIEHQQDNQTFADYIAERVRSEESS